MCPDNALHTGNAWTGSYRTEALAKQRNIQKSQLLPFSFTEKKFSFTLPQQSKERISNYTDHELKTAVPVECSESNLKSLVNVSESV